MAKPLTARQQEIHDLIRPVSEGGQGKTRNEAAAMLGISANVIGKTVTVINKKLEIKNPAGGGSYRAAEVTDPERAAAMIDVGTDPFTKVRDAIKASGFPVAAGEALLRRLRSKFANVTTEVRNLKTQEILEMMGKRIHLALEYMDDKVMAEASFRDLALGTTAMLEKRALLRGEPTQIISDHERKKLHELLPELIAEGKRRGITIEGTAQIVKEASSA